MKIFFGFELFEIFSNGKRRATEKSIGLISGFRFFVYLKSWPSVTVTYSPKRKTTNLSCKCLECWIVEPYTKIVWQPTESMACFVCFSFQMEMRGWVEIQVVPNALNKRHALFLPLNDLHSLLYVSCHQNEYYTMRYDAKRKK